MPEYRHPERAAEFARAVLAIKETAGRYDTLGAALLASGDAEAAFSAYRNAIALDEEYTARLAGDLRSLGCLAETSIVSGPEEVDAALALCLERAIAPFVLAEGVERIDLIKLSDPENARQHLVALSEKYPELPDVLRLLLEEEVWPDG